MVPLVEASRGRLITSDSSSATYEGRFDDYWSIIGVPNGGYSFGSANACVQDYLANHLRSSHKDLYHAASTFLNAVEADKSWTLAIQVMKAGRNFSNIDATLSQKSNKTGKDTIRLQMRYIYCDMVRYQSDAALDHLTIQPGSKLYPTFPTVSEPKECTTDVFRKAHVYKFRESVQSFIDEKAQKVYDEQNTISTAGYTHFNKEKVADEDATWFNYVAIMLYVDIIWHSRSFVPKDRINDPIWYPTMSLDVEMKHPLPSFPLLRITHFKTIRLVDHGQMDMNFEVWSHPDDAARLGLPKGIKGILLCVARQAALTTPASVQTSISAKNKNQVGKL